MSEHRESCIGTPLALFCVLTVLHRVRRSAYAIAPALLVLGVAAASSSTEGPRGTLAVVAEASHESGGINYPSDVYVVNVDGKHLRNLTHDGASNGVVEWMPDGRRIVFQRQPSDPSAGRRTSS
jgi:dipeptidyl aminopeptidase/acylaminoacyl peptidase